MDYGDVWSYYTKADSQYFVSEVLNYTPNTIYTTNMVVKLFNGTVEVGSSPAKTFLAEIPPYQKTCFIAEFVNPPEWDRPDFSGGFFTVDPPIWTQGFTMKKLFYYDDQDRLTVYGSLTNASGSQVDSAHVVGTVYDDQGWTIDCASISANPLLIDDGADAYFTLTFTNASHYQVQTFTLQPEGKILPPLPAPALNMSTEAQMQSMIPPLHPVLWSPERYTGDRPNP